MDPDDVQIESELDCAHKIVSIFAADYDGPDTGVGVHSPHINRLEILIYRPDGQGWSYSGSVTTIDDSSPTDPGAVYPFGTLTLPNDLLVGADRALVFDNADTMPKAVKTFAGLSTFALNIELHCANV